MPVINDKITELRAVKRPNRLDRQILRHLKKIKNRLEKVVDAWVKIKNVVDWAVQTALGAS